VLFQVLQTSLIISLLIVPVVLLAITIRILSIILGETRKSMETSEKKWPGKAVWIPHTALRKTMAPPIRVPRKALRFQTQLIMESLALKSTKPPQFPSWTIPRISTIPSPVPGKAWATFLES